MAWTRGSEPAFTLVHNFLLTGVLATIAGLLLIVWSLQLFVEPAIRALCEPGPSANQTSP
jgi:hypothetical protein